MSVRLVLLCILVLAPQAIGASAEPFAPTAAVAYKAGDLQAVVSWLPGEELADTYNVYGLSETGPTFLDDLTPSEEPGPLSMVVPATFPAYAVSGVKDGQESGLVRAVGAGDYCILITDDPSVSIGNDCPLLVQIRPLVKVRSAA